MTITVERRSDDYIAYLSAVRWESGRTPDEAIAKLVITYQDLLGITVVLPPIRT